MESEGKQSPSSKNLQGPRPPPLSIHRNSHKIKKPPKPPPSHPPPPSNLPPPQPIIIYAVSPKIIHSTVADFMTTVQRLTGVSADNFTSAGDLSPAARLASISPKPRQNSPHPLPPTNTNTSFELDELEEQQVVQVNNNRVPGILSPSTLPPVIQEMYFSPAVTDHNPFNSLNPFGNSGLLSSPSASGFFPAALGSPILSPDFFGQIWNF